MIETVGIFETALTVYNMYQDDIYVHKKYTKKPAPTYKEWLLEHIVKEKENSKRKIFRCAVCGSKMINVAPVGYNPVYECTNQECEYYGGE